MAEYDACIVGLKAALDMNLKDLKFVEILSWSLAIPRKSGVKKPRIGQI